MQTSCEQYDKGYHIEAKRLAVIIRVLVHDTPKSTSLLAHLKIKEKIYYYNTAIPDTKFGLTNVMTTTEDRGKTIYIAPLDKGGTSRKKRTWIIFKTWWEEMTVLSDGKNTFTRKQLVQSVANKDGRAHIASEIHGAYKQISRKNSLNVYHNRSGVLKAVNDIELASIRQIAELLKSLEGKYPELFLQNTETFYYFKFQVLIE